VKGMPEVGWAVGVSLMFKLKRSKLHSPGKDMTKLDLFAFF
jgi:hypothetical protein